MARKSTTNEIKAPLELLVSQEEAKARLAERIEKGKERKLNLSKLTPNKI